MTPSKLGSFDAGKGGEGEAVRGVDCGVGVFFPEGCVLLSGGERCRLRGLSDTVVADFVSGFVSDLQSIFGRPFFAGALPFTWEGDGVVVLAGGGAGGGGVGALAEGVAEEAGLLTQGLCSLSLSLACVGFGF